MTPEHKLADLGITLPSAAPPAANYVPTVIAGNLMHISGQIPFAEDGSLMKGRLGDTVDVPYGQAAARRCAVGLIAQMKTALGDLSRVKRVVKLGVFVASHPDFTDQPEVGNGASDLMIEVFGDAGRHTRLAVGGGRAFVSVNKALVTQASSAIPVVPLYISLLYRVMKEKGLHEGCIEQMRRLFVRLYQDHPTPVDSEGRIRIDDWEMREDIQKAVEALWPQVTTENLQQLADTAGYREEFLKLFGFGLPGIDYEAETEPHQVG